MRAAPGFGPEPGQRHAVDEDLSRTRLEQTGEQLQQGGLAAARGSCEGDGLARADVEAHVLQNQGIVRAVAERHLARLDRDGPGFRLPGHLVGDRLGRRQGDVGQAFGVQAEHAQVDHGVDQAARAPQEHVHVGEKCHEQADREHVVEDHPCGEIDHEDAEGAQQEPVRGLEHQVEALGGQLRFVVSTRRLSQCARRSRWPLKSLMVFMPRSVSRKWLSRRAAQMIASDEACRSGM